MGMPRRAITLAILVIACQDQNLRNTINFASQSSSPSLRPPTGPSPPIQFGAKMTESAPNPWEVWLEPRVPVRVSKAAARRKVLVHLPVCSHTQREARSPWSKIGEYQRPYISQAGEVTINSKGRSHALWSVRLRDPTTLTRFKVWAVRSVYNVGMHLWALLL